MLGVCDVQNVRESATWHGVGRALRVCLCCALRVCVCVCVRACVRACLCVLCG